MTYSFGDRSNKKLLGVHPRLAAVARKAISISTVDFGVIEGIRPRARQRELYGQGRTAAEMIAVGLPADLARPDLPKVTWTLNSRHFQHPATGFGHAVDCLPVAGWDAPREVWDAMALSMFRAAMAEGLLIRWGADWDRDGKPRETGEYDSPHFEIFKL